MLNYSVAEIRYNKLDGEKFIIQEKEEEIGKEEK